MIRQLSGVLLIAYLLSCPGDAWGWGSKTHSYLNQHSVQHLPAGMSQLAAQQTFLTSHASDADARKSTDPSEDPKHYIDLESFTDYHHLPADLSVVVARYGALTVADYGILPWTIAAVTDSLAAQFRRSDWNAACQTAADLGHYVADAYQPLHCTVNYNGQLTGNGGIHSRYETTMMGQYLSTLSVHADTVKYVSDVFAFALDIALRTNTLADSIMQADNAAKAASGWTSGSAYSQLYYSTLWGRTGQYTQSLLQDATRDIAALWYTAWVNATATSVAETEHASLLPVSCSLAQNYPNPFNPTTTIGLRVAGSGLRNAEATPLTPHPSTLHARLAVYDLLGREVAVLMDEDKSPGTYAATWNAAGMASGTYFYRIQVTGDRYMFTETKRMTLVR
jgi:hypothetical protein